MSRSIFIATLLVVTSCATSQAEVVFDNIPDSLALNYPSLGYQATQTAEFGDKISFGGTGRSLSSATFTMSSWALQSNNPGFGDATGFDHAVTLNIYAAGSGDSVGALLGTKTQTFHMLWRPEVFDFGGIAFNIKFDLADLGVTLPETAIYGLAYDTQTWGYNPIGVEGPYCSLNFACKGIAPTVGSDVDPDGVYWNTKTAAWYADGGAGGVGTFRKDWNWTGYAPMARFETLGEPSVPGPAAVLPFAVGLLAAAKRRRK